MKKLNLLIMLIAFFTLQSISQTAVTGIVTDKNSGNPLQGVSVVEKETGNVTVTDVQGNFKLYVTNPKRTLVFTCIGYNTHEIKLKGRKKINVRLKSTQLIVVDDIEDIDEEYVAPTKTYSIESNKRSEITNSSRTKTWKNRKKTSGFLKGGKNKEITTYSSPKGFVKISNDKTLSDPVTGSESYSKIS